MTLGITFKSSLMGTAEETKKAPEETKRTVNVHRAGKRQIARKLESEAALESAMPWHFQEGDCYHCFSWGDVDSATYLKMVLRQQKIKYLAISTWCMAGEDVRDLLEWHRRGMIGRIDLYVGEIFQSSYPEVWVDALKLAEECGGRVCVFRNHSKIMAIEGERFDVLIESSANVNTNPRSENTVLTVDRNLVTSYINLLSSIVPFNRDMAGHDVYTRAVEDTKTNNTNENVKS